MKTTILIFSVLFALSAVFSADPIGAGMSAGYAGLGFTSFVLLAIHDAWRKAKGFKIYVSVHTIKAIMMALAVVAFAVPFAVLATSAATVVFIVVVAVFFAGAFGFAVYEGSASDADFKKRMDRRF